jgi:hypothetical protein
MTSASFFVIVIVALAFICFLKWFHENWEDICTEVSPYSGYQPEYQAPKRPLCQEDHDLIELCIYVGIDEQGITRREYDMVLTPAQQRSVVEAGYQVVYG